MTNDDELVERLRRTLQAEASQVTSPDDAWARFQAAGGRPAPAPLQRPGRAARFGVPAGALGLAAAVLVAVLVTSGSSHKNRSTEVATAASPTTAASAATVAPRAAASATTQASSAFGSATTAPAAPALGASPSTSSTGFAAQSVTFVSSDEGWVLGSVTCGASACEVLRHTTDGGHTWTPGNGPPTTLVAHLRFADPSDGWAWGGSELWATHDGGGTWTRVSVSGLAAPWTVEDLEASRGLAQVAVIQDGGSVRLATTAAGSDAWRLSPTTVTLGAGPVPQGQLVLQGAVGWFVQVDRTVVGGARLSGGIWQPWTPPCADDNGPAWLAASSPEQLVVVCDAGVWGPPAAGTSPGEHVYVSADGGATWTEPGPVPLPNVTAVAAAPGVITIAGFGATSAVLISSFDGGRTRPGVYDAPAGVTAVAELGFTTALQGVAVLTGPADRGSLVMTRDGAHTWAPVTFP
jgi:hypothetical protein